MEIREELCQMLFRGGFKESSFQRTSTVIYQPMIQGKVWLPRFAPLPSRSLLDGS